MPVKRPAAGKVAAQKGKGDLKAAKDKLAKNRGKAVKASKEAKLVDKVRKGAKELKHQKPSKNKEKDGRSQKSSKELPVKKDKKSKREKEKEKRARKLALAAEAEAECGEEGAEEESPRAHDPVVKVKARKKGQGSTPSDSRGPSPKPALPRFFEAAEANTAERYEKCCNQIRPGKLLEAQHVDGQGFVLGSVLYLVDDLVINKRGSFVEAEFLAKEGKPGKHFEKVQPGCGTLLHLCRKESCQAKLSSSGEDAVDILHVQAWRERPVEHCGKSSSAPWTNCKVVDRLLKKKEGQKGGKKRKSPRDISSNEASEDSDLPEAPTRSRSQPVSDEQASRTELMAALAPKARVDLTDRDQDLDKKIGDAEASDKKSSSSLRGASVGQLKDRLKELKSEGALQKEEEKKKTTRQPKRRSLLETLQQGKRARGSSGAQKEASKRLSQEDSEGSASGLPREPKEGRGKKKKKKKEKKSRSRSKSSSSSSSSHSSDGLFRESHHSERGLASRILHLAKKKPGKLLSSTVKQMHGTLHPGQAVVGLPPILNQFLQQAVATSTQLEGRNLRELQTIALAGDQILKGNLEAGMEILLQRWKRVEAVATGLLPSKAAEHLELLPPTKPTSLSLEEREEAATMSQRWNNYERKASGSQGNQY